ncbi:cobyric acid synthase [Thioalkalicoccus limnaeus]|uniref:Cobyric acid synthase n=1 Tax=Thioalkalicoccus limnaeus TaxID=120681 RepID=A0ABV4BCS9_9GAMM
MSITAQTFDLDLPPLGDHGPRRARTLMIQGTASDVGKSLIVAGLGRAYSRRGLAVRPFKAQNMSNNAAVAIDSDWPPGPDGRIPPGEIGRAQALQAQACRASRSVHMNPVLLKPQSDLDCQVILRGRPIGSWSASAYQALKPRLLPAVLDSLNRLAADADLILIEGAGSGAEQYLRAQDISNMGLAEAGDIPVVLLGDDSRGGVMAAMIGAHALWTPSERARVAGYLINKFRGDPAVFAPACTEISRRTGWPSLGIVQWFAAAHNLPPEDSLALEVPADISDPSHRRPGLTVAVPRLPRIANFDDLGPLAAEPGVRLHWVPSGRPIPRDVDVILLPGSKATRADMEALHREGWDQDIFCHRRHGGAVVGLCGGFQMLGRMIHDPDGIEGPPGSTPGLGLLALETWIGPTKHLVELAVLDRRSGQRVTGYEMHMGRSSGPALDRPWLRLDDGTRVRAEGAESSDGRVMGSYLHGLFAADGFRHHWLARFGQQSDLPDYGARIEATLDALADRLEADLDLDRLLELAR